MKISEIVEKIMCDDNFVNSEIETLSSYYQLKHTTRWAHNRTEDETESVAEHIFGMHILIDYFYPLVSESETLDLDSIRHLATWHDMAEAFVGDMTANTKTKEHEQKEKIAETDIVKNSPAHLTTMLQEVYQNFDARITREASFVKALDKIEPIFHLHFLASKENDLARHFNLGWGVDEYRSYRHPYVSEFPLIKKFDDILYEMSKASNFFPKI